MDAHEETKNILRETISDEVALKFNMDGRSKGDIHKKGMGELSYYKLLKRKNCCWLVSIRPFTFKIQID